MMAGRMTADRRLADARPFLDRIGEAADRLTCLVVESKPQWRTAADRLRFAERVAREGWRCVTEITGALQQLGPICGIDHHAASLPRHQRSRNVIPITRAPRKRRPTGKPEITIDDDDGRG